jgi:hypothetical protein
MNHFRKLITSEPVKRERLSSNLPKIMAEKTVFQSEGNSENTSGASVNKSVVDS